MMSKFFILLMVMFFNVLHPSHTYAVQQLHAITSTSVTETTLLSTVQGGYAGRFVSSNNQIITANGDRLSIWNIETDNRIELEHSIFPELVEDEVIEEIISVSPMGSLVAFSTFNRNNFNGKLWLLDLDTERATILVEGNRQVSSANYQPQRDLDFSPDGMVLARTVPYSIELWNVETHERLGYLGEGDTLHTGDVYGVAFSPDGQIIASSGGSYPERRDTTVRLWNAETHELNAVLEGHTATVFNVAFSPDGSLLASSSQDGTIRLWSMETFETVRIIETDYWQNFSDLVFSPDGSLLVFPGLDGVINCWDVQTGNQVVTLQDAENQSDGIDRISSLAFNSDGTYLVSTIRNVIQLWGIPSEAGD